MADVIIEGRISQIAMTKAQWTEQNPVLISGEIGFEKDTNLFKFGNGTTPWNTLPYASSKPAELKTTDPLPTDSEYELGTMWLNTSTKKLFIIVDNTASSAVWKNLLTSVDVAGVGDMLKSTFATNAKITQGYVDKAITADTATGLKTARNIKLTGDITGQASFSGTADATINGVLSNTGVTAGTYTKVTVDAKGRVTVGGSLTANDIPTLSLAKISDVGTVATKNVGTSAGNVPVLGTGGKLDESLLPAIAITEVFECSSQSAMVALTAQTGDVAIRTDLNKCFILKTIPASILANWAELRTPTDTVLSVNSKTGAVTLSSSDIGEGTNKYYTEARATANFNSNFATKNISDLADGNTVVKNTDRLILTCKLN